MSEVVIYTSGTLGDHLPFVALGQALAERGHRVRMAVNSAMVPLVHSAGLEAVELPEEPLDPAAARRHARWWDHWKGVPAAQRRGKAGDALPLIRCLLELSRSAELLITTSIRPWAWVANQATGVPYLTVSVTPGEFWRPKAGDLRRRFLADRALAEDKDHARQRQLGRHLGIRLPDSLPKPSPQVILASSPHFFCPDPAELEPLECVVHPTGFWFGEDPTWAGWSPTRELREFVERTPRPIALTFSSLPLKDRKAVLDVHVRAVARLGRPLLVLGGWAGFTRDDLSPDLREHDVAFADAVPHDWLFARIDCAIQHGGIGSIARALRQACPLLIEPYGNDQFFNAMQIVSLGVGSAMQPEKLSVDGLVQVLKKILSSPYRRRSAALAKAIRSDPGLASACTIVEDVLRRTTTAHESSRPPARESHRDWKPQPVA